MVEEGGKAAVIVMEEEMVVEALSMINPNRRKELYLLLNPTMLKSFV